jgi:hypothetical protein
LLVGLGYSMQESQLRLPFLVVPQATVDEGELKKKRVLRHPC